MGHTRTANQSRQGRPNPAHFVTAFLILILILILILFHLSPLFLSSVGQRSMPTSAASFYRSSMERIVPVSPNSFRPPPRPSSPLKSILSHLFPFLPSSPSLASSFSTPHFVPATVFELQIPAPPFNGVKTFGAIVSKTAPRQDDPTLLRRDYSFLFERFYYFLEDLPQTEMGLVVFDELEKAKSRTEHIASHSPQHRSSRKPPKRPVARKDRYLKNV